MKKTTVIFGLILVIALTGCSTLRRITGKNDDTVLPGAREEILSPENQTAKDPAVMGNQATQQ